MVVFCVFNHLICFFFLFFSVHISTVITLCCILDLGAASKSKSRSLGWICRSLYAKSDFLLQSEKQKVTELLRSFNHNAVIVADPGNVLCGLLKCNSQYHCRSFLFQEIAPCGELYVHLANAGRRTFIAFTLARAPTWRSDIMRLVPR